MTADLTKAPARPWIFEPHNGYGSTDPDGNPWPIGYLSEGSPTLPVLELNNPGIGTDDEKFAAIFLIVKAVNAYDRHLALIAELRGVLSRTRAKLRDFIREHPDPGDDAFAVEWEAGEVLARSQGGAQ